MPRFSKPIEVEALIERFNLQYEGDRKRIIQGVETLSQAGPNDLSFFTSKTYLPDLRATKAGVVLLAPADTQAFSGDKLLSEHPRMAYAQLASWLFRPDEQSKQGVHPTATIGENVELHPSAYVGPQCAIADNCVIGEGVCLISNVSIGRNCTIGADTLVYPSVVLYHDSHLGKGCCIHGGTVIGSDGFGFEPDEKGKWHKIPQIGGVRVADGVEIGSNTTIDRGAVQDTVIGEGVIIDNLVHIAHNVSIGAHSAIAGCTAISGSTTIGRHCLIGGGTCIKGHIQIVDGSHISGMSMVTRSIRKAGVYSSGIPAKEKTLWLKNAARFHQLDDIARRVKALESSNEK